MVDGENQVAAQVGCVVNFRGDQGTVVVECMDARWSHWELVMGMVELIV